MNEKKKGMLGLIILLLITFGICFTAAVGIGPTKTGSAANIKLGLDLAGGVSITYEVVDTEFTQEQLSDTIYKLQLRVQNYSTEADVYQEGNNRINVEIPGVSDANTILEELGKPGSLVFVDVDGNTVLTGSDVAGASAVTQNSQTTGVREYMVQLTLTEEGAQKFREATEAAVTNQDPIYIIYDGAIISAPLVQVVITDGSCVIQGMESYEAATNLASTIRIGSLPLELKELRSNVVGAKLGQEAISTSLFAGFLGLLAILVFLVCVYRIGGVASGIALILYWIRTWTFKWI